MREALKKVGSKWLFEFFLQQFHNEIIEGLKKLLASYSEADIRRMVKNQTFPDVPPELFRSASQYAEYLEAISVERLVEEFLAPARPDLIAALEDMGMAGAQWLVALHAHLLKCIKEPEKAPTPQGPKTNIVMAKCDICGKSWPVPREQFDSITECPFCHHGKDERVDNATPSGDNEVE